MKFKPVLGAALLLGISGAVAAAEDALHQRLREADAVLFERGFNRCDFAALERLVHPQLDFFHDQGGMQDRAQFFAAVRANLCADPMHKPIRKLVEGSLEIEPLRKDGKLYGAIQFGRHEFYRVDAGQAPRFTSRARFIHTWLLDAQGEWQLRSVLSFAHQSGPDPAAAR